VGRAPREVRAMGEVRARTAQVPAPPTTAQPHPPPNLTGRARPINHDCPAATQRLSTRRPLCFAAAASSPHRVSLRRATAPLASTFHALTCRPAAASRSRRRRSSSSTADSGARARSSSSSCCVVHEGGGEHVRDLQGWPTRRRVFLSTSGAAAHKQRPSVPSGWCWAQSRRLRPYRTGRHQPSWTVFRPVVGRRGR
jgi:hypothetical protein